MNTEAQNYKEGNFIDHTPAAALTAGQLLQVAGLAAMAATAIAASAKGAVQVKGILKIAAAAVIGNAGDNAWWDENGTPVGGSTTGALTTSAPDGDFWLGTLTAALAAADGEAKVDLNVANPDLPAWPERVHELLTDDLTLDAEDGGKVLHIATDAKTFTLPATAVGIDVIFQNDAADAASLLSISPNASDKIQGPNIAGTDNKDQLNTKTTSIRGDWMHIVGIGGIGWEVKGSRGIWAEEA